jgi:hypothetical protein
VAHPVLTRFWMAGLAKTLEQPLPAPDHADSVQPRVVAERVSRVPPTAVTVGALAGKLTP